MWTFGLSGDELRVNSQCGRPVGHRGDCRHIPPKDCELPGPWRTIFYDPYPDIGSLYRRLAQPAPPLDPLGPGPGMERDTFND
jgi:hypothetical protein